jgi:hypothetical protein
LASRNTAASVIEEIGRRSTHHAGDFGVAPHTS